ncbi:DNA adenine methylase [Cupriavidus pauculus]|uniref:DNA adenine methylase n=1 Tax=Cupriavidus pauculus TaxID=82633 RepID=UPI001D0C0CAE|nr:Dam family site-specific DNA-(adenine-N6)-methyltransferase [Cupriavidus pauculus]
MAILPFLKWAGGKRWLAKELKELIGDTRGRYFEPFAGGAAVFFALRPQEAFLSDSNGELINAYSAVKFDWRRLQILLQDHQAKHSEEHYYSVRGSMPRGRYERAARFIYLNRTCWNGLYRVNQRGEFNVPKGTKTAVLLDTDDFKAISAALKHAELCTTDFEAQIQKASRGDTIFADPPYTVKHKFNGFVKYNEHIFAWKDQVRLAEALVDAKKRGVRVFSTNADHESIRGLYERHFDITEVSRFSSIAGNGTARGQYPELIISG